MRVTLENGQFGWDYVLEAEDGRTRLIQLDWDYPGVAMNLGYVPCSECSATDGTIDCAHKTTGQMIAAAHEWLENHTGESFEDPGYFDQEG